MNNSQIISDEELVRLLQEEKVKEFNELRPRCLRETSERGDQDFELATQKQRSDPRSFFQELVRSIPESLYLPGIEFSNLNLNGVNFSGVRFAEADFSGSILTDANLSSAECDYVDFEGAKMDGANIMDTSFFQANLKGVDLSKVKSLGYARFAEAQGISLEQQQHILTALKRTWE